MIRSFLLRHLVELSIRRKALIQHSLWGMEQTVQHQKVFMHSSKEKAQENSKELREDGVYPMLKWEESLPTADCVLILYAD